MRNPLPPMGVFKPRFSPPKELIDVLKRMDPEELWVRNAEATAQIKKWRPTITEAQLHTNSLAGAHKARLAIGEHFTASELSASREWLVDHGFKPEWRMPFTI